MMHNQSKKALYEVIAKAKLNTGPDKPLQQPAQPLREPAAAPKPVEPVIIEKPVATPPSVSVQAPPKAEKPAKWLNKPRAVQLNDGRLEISIPVQAGIAILLGLVLVVLMVFRAGQLYTHSKQKTLTAQAEPAAKVTAKATPKVLTNTAQATPAPAAPAVNETVAVKKEEQAAPGQKGDHIIVIARSVKGADLEPVQKFFGENGIETKIEQRGDKSVLVTKNAYENPLRSGTDGHAILAKIVKVGAGYKAPAGYESFPKSFSDAYAEKVK
jgi:hypothetical protein